MVPSTAPPPRHIVTILVIEDNLLDIRLLREALLSENDVRLWFAYDAENAIRLLDGPGGRPDLILLDLNLPHMDGRALLGTLKSRPDLCAIPVIVLTGSSDPHDVQSTYQLHANCYIGKPTDFFRLQQIMHRVVEFWSDTVLLPHGVGGPRADAPRAPEEQPQE